MVLILRPAVVSLDTGDEDFVAAPIISRYTAHRLRVVDQIECLSGRQIELTREVRGAERRITYA